MKQVVTIIFLKLISHILSIIFCKSKIIQKFVSFARSESLLNFRSLLNKKDIFQVKKSFSHLLIFSFFFLPSYAVAKFSCPIAYFKAWKCFSSASYWKKKKSDTLLDVKQFPSLPQASGNFGSTSDILIFT